jgi:hypothetical protein
VGSNPETNVVPEVEQELGAAVAELTSDEKINEKTKIPNLLSNQGNLFSKVQCWAALPHVS